MIDKDQGLSAEEVAKLLSSAIKGAKSLGMDRIVVDLERKLAELDPVGNPWWLDETTVGTKGFDS